MHHIAWSTDTLAIPDRFAAWHDVLGARFNRIVPRVAMGERTAFWAQITERRIGPCGVVDVACMPHVSGRGAADARRCASDEIHVYVETSGGAAFQAPRLGELRLRRQSIFVSAPDIEFRLAGLQAPASCSMVVTLPRAYLAQVNGGRAPDIAPQLLTAERPGGGLFTDYVSLFLRRLPALPDDVAARGLHALAGLLIAAAGLPQAEALSPHAAAARHDLALQIISQRQDDAGLTAAVVAAAMGISPRSLHRAFEAGGGSFTASLRGARLRRVRHRLVDPAWAARSVADIAFASGFDSLATFNRQFRAAYGCTPRDTRAAAMALDEQVLATVAETEAARPA